MTRTIKFRGRRLDNGELFFGNGVYQDPPLSKEEKKLGFVSRTYIIGTEFPLLAKLWHPVDPESVAQLVGYDANGREVYEGDTIIHTMSNHESVAEYGYNPAYIKMAKLKEAQS